jgi:MCM OB domain
MEMEKLHQQAEAADINGGAADVANVRSNFPDQLRRRYEVYLTLPSDARLAPMRGVTSNDLGRLVRIKVRASASQRRVRQSRINQRHTQSLQRAAGWWAATVPQEHAWTCPLVPGERVPARVTPQRAAERRAQGVVTHCTDVKPLIAVATYLDITSGVEIFQEILSPAFTPIDKGSAAAKEANPKGEPTLQMRGSKLVKFQQVKLQEMSDEVPTSATPRRARAFHVGDVRHEGHEHAPACRVHRCNAVGFRCSDNCTCT